MIGATGKEMGSSPQGGCRALLRLLREEQGCRHPACWVPWDEARQQEKEEEATRGAWRSQVVARGCRGGRTGSLVQGSRGWWETQRVAVLWDPGFVCVERPSD